jgi:hypothetical protein
MLSFFDLLGRKTTVSVANPLPVTGGAASGSAPSGNPTLVAGSDGTTVRTVRTDTSGNVSVTIVGASSQTFGSDAYSVTNGGITTRAHLSLFNGTGFDRGRSVTAADATTGTGLLGAGILGQFQTTLTTYTAGQFGTIAMSNRGVLYQTPTDANGNTLISSGSADGVAGSNGEVVMGRSFMFNNTTWDRVRGDTTGGLYVQERERAQLYQETGGAVAASTPLNGASRDVGSGSVVQWLMFAGMVRPAAADGAGTIVLQGSYDGTTWVNTATAAAPVGVVTVLSTAVFFRYNRVVFLNGTTAQTSLIMASRYSA